MISEIVAAVLKRLSKRKQNFSFLFQRWCLINALKNEVVSSGKVELVHSGVTETGPLCRGKLTTEGFYVFRNPRSDKGVERGPRKPVKPVKAVKVSKAKRGPGRPRVYNGTHRRIVASFLKKHGLTRGIELLATERKLNVSVTLALSVAEEHGIKFKRGRPAA